MRFADLALQVTYLVVSKSHGTRLFPLSEGDALRGNVMPGTVVDTQLVAPLKYEFFINPHAGIQVCKASLSRLPRPLCDVRLVASVLNVLGSAVSTDRLAVSAVLLFLNIAGYSCVHSIAEHSSLHTQSDSLLREDMPCCRGIV